MSYTAGLLETGRIGNQLIRNIAVSFIAEKHDLYVNYANNDFFKHLGINLYCGKNKYEKIQRLTDNNYFLILNSTDKLKTNLNSDKDYFQTRKITRMIYNYLHSENIKSNIIEKNNFKDRYNNNNDLFVHVRLDDATKFTPIIDYYINTINNINYENLYISTDEPSHQIIKELLVKFPSANLFLQNEFLTFQFASTCKYIILSRGTFSASIGYLAFYSTVYYPKNDINIIEINDKIFPNDKWIKVDY